MKDTFMNRLVFGSLVTIALFLMLFGVVSLGSFGAK